MAQRPKDRKTPPQGTFSGPTRSSGGQAGGQAGAEPKRQVGVPPPLPERPARQVVPAPPAVSFPPPSYEHGLGADEVVLGDIEANKSVRSPSTLPPPLGQSEEHDAWTMDRLSRQSTVPPVRHDDVDRLRKLSATNLDVAPDIAPKETGGALDLIDRSRPSVQLDLVGEMEELYALDDLTGALRHAELILGRTPDNEQARRCADNCRNRLLALYTSKIGATDRVVSLALSESQLRWLGLDHRSGFLLSRVDGLSTVEELLDVCGMPRLEALKTLADLLDRGAIRLGRS